MTAKELLVAARLDKSHWGKRIIAAEVAGGFDEQDSTDAGGWATCACGKQDPRIPRNKNCIHYGKPGSPKDPELSELGNDFSLYVDLVDPAFEETWDYEQDPDGPPKMDFTTAVAKAAETLIAIEKRAIEVLIKEGYVLEEE